MAPIGTPTQRSDAQATLIRGRRRAALLPDLLVEAQRIANTLAQGWHGRRQRGTGDTFWQFRPYDQGESVARVDWRRTARDDAITMRDHEWEAAHTVWVFADESASMRYRSSLAGVDKQSRALVLALALAEMAGRGGERVGWPGLSRAVVGRSRAERIAARLAAAGDLPDLPPADAMGRRNELVWISDFLGDPDAIDAHADRLARAGVRGLMIQVVDPAEERFPFQGRTEFRDPESGARLTFGRAETIEEDYRAAFTAHTERLGRMATRMGWTHIRHTTDRLASEALVAAHVRLSQEMAA